MNVARYRRTMYSVRSSIGGRDRNFRAIATSAVGLLAIGFMLVEHGTISPVVIGAGVPLGLVVAFGDRTGSLLALGWSVIPIEITVTATASIPARIRAWTTYVLLGLLVAAIALVAVALFHTPLEAWHVLNVSFGTLLGITVAEFVGA